MNTLSTMEVEICFLLQDSLNSEPLTPPDIARNTASMVRSAEAVGHEAELAAYYAQALQLARKQGLGFDQIRHHFWLRLWLWNSEANVHISFPWYDTLSEMDPVLTALSTLAPGQTFHDIDQGWEIELSARDTLIHIRHGNPDDEDGTPQTEVSVPRAALSDQIASLRARTLGLIAHLSGALGCDVWSAPLKPQSAVPAAPR
jgi:hypothetical protein